MKRSYGIGCAVAATFFALNIPVTRAVEARAARAGAAETSGMGDERTESGTRLNAAQEDIQKPSATADDEAKVEPASPAQGTESEAEGSPPAAAGAQPEAGEEEEVIEKVEPEVIEEKGFFPLAFDGDNAARRDRGVNVLTARAARKKSLVLIIDDRPYQILFTGEDVFFDFFGFDGGNLKVGIGLRYSIIEGLDAGFTRLSDGRTVAFDTYEFNARYAFLRQEKHEIDAALLAGVSWFAQKGRKDVAGRFAQLFIDRVFLDMLLLGAGFGFHSDSSSDEKAADDDAFSGAIFGIVEWRMIDPLAFTADIAANVFGYEEKWPAFSFAIKVLTHRHVFSLILTNTQFILSDGIVADAWRGLSDWVFGFQTTREFNFGNS